MDGFISNNTLNTLKNIMDYFYSKSKNMYVPAIINEGSLLDNGTELYIKLMAVDREVKIDKTWFKENLSMDVLDKCFNIITQVNYKYNDLFVVNPNIIDNNYVTMLDPVNNTYMDMEYYGDNKINHNKVLLLENDNLYVYFPAIRGFSGMGNYVPNYDFYVEIEYRTYNDNVKPSKLGVFNVDDGIVDLIYSESSGLVLKDKKMQYWLRATIRLDLNKFDLNPQELSNSKIKVVNLDNGNVRDLNISNYNDDTNAGLVVFSNEAKDTLKKYYYFYDLVLIPKSQNVKACLVDYLDDCIVFWEGEFNSHLPEELKQELEKYNITNKTEKIISDAMFAWQLGGVWDYYEKLLPSQKLAYKIKNSLYNVAIENGIDFYPPMNIEEYSNFVKMILKICNLEIDNLNMFDSKKELLKNIVNKSHCFESQRAIYDNFQGLCYFLLKELNYD